MSDTVNVLTGKFVLALTWLCLGWPGALALRPAAGRAAAAISRPVGPWPVPPPYQWSGV